MFSVKTDLIREYRSAFNKPKMLARFNNGDRNPPTAPTIRELRVIVQDLKDGRIDTNTRFGRKPQWKDEHKKKFIETLLEGNIPVDAVSVSAVDGIDRCINGNNRMRAILSFANNEYGIDVVEEGDGGRVHTYYYSAVPDFERNNPRRNRFCHVLPVGIKSTFDRYPMHMNIRRGLTEEDEVHWYTSMNKNMKRHTPGQILLTTLCVPDDETVPFVDTLIAAFPQIKPRINMPSAEGDSASVGIRLAELFDVDVDVVDERGFDKNEDTLLSLACVHNLIATGKPYDHGFKGEFDRDIVNENYRKLMSVFDGLSFSEEMRNYFKESASSSKKFLPKVWSAAFVLGPIAWSIANGKEGAVDIWRAFLEYAHEERFELTYITGDEHSRDALTKRRRLPDSSATKYSIAWDRVLQWYTINTE